MSYDEKHNYKICSPLKKAPFVTLCVQMGQLFVFDSSQDTKATFYRFGSKIKANTNFLGYSLAQSGSNN